MRLKNMKLLNRKCFINGEWCESASGRSYPVTNPANGEKIIDVPDMGSADAKKAIDAASAAFKNWRALPAKDRAQILNRWFRLIIENKEDLALLLTTEQGKPLSEAQGEVVYAASFVEWFAEESKRVYGDVIPATQKNQRIVVTKEPVGVVVAITPWNFPVAMITRKVAPALAAGCTVVIKPAEDTPLCALALAALAEEAGVPKGVLNVVTAHSPQEIGRELTENPTVRKISFTGSTAVGKLLMRQGAATLKKLSLELGGNAPFIIFEDANLDRAVQGAIQSKFRNAGQTCVCTNRFFVHSRVYDEFASRLTAAVRELTVGEGNEPGVKIGPLINASAVQKVEAHLKDAVQKGAVILTGGKRHAKGGNFFEPTVIRDASGEMLFTQEETFGPLAGLVKFESEDEVIAMANDTSVGLASYFYTENISRAWRVADALECGIVGINEGLISNEVAPFGGTKESGQGREGSKYGILDFLEIKYLMFGGL